MGYPRVANALLVAALLVYAVDAALEQLTASADLWWQLASGRYIVEHLAIPARDSFSYTYPGARWFDPEWLAQLMLFAMFRVGGGTALALFKVAAVLATLGLSVRLAWRRSGSLLLSVAPALAASLLCRTFLDIRPDLFLYLGTLIVLTIIDAYRRGSGPAALFLLPVTMTFWVNLHGSFLYGLGVIVLYAGVELAKALLGLPDASLSIERARRLAFAAAAAGLACLLNPDGPGAFTFPFVILRPDAAAWRQATEWLPAVLFQDQAFNPALFGYFLVAEILVTLAVLVAAPRRLDLSDSLLVVVTGAMALRGRRFIPLFALVSVPFLARGLAVLRARFLPRPAGTPELRRPRDAIAAGVLAVVAVALLLTAAAPRVRQKYADGFFEGMIDGSFFPASAVEFLRSNSAPARLFHLYAWGGYLEFQLPARMAFIDGRGGTVYPGAFYRDETRAEFGYPGWDAFLDRYDVELILWQTAGAAEAGREGLLRNLLGSAVWERIYDDGYATIFAHRARAQDWIEQYRTFRLVYPDVSRAQFFLGAAYLNGLAFEQARQKLRDVARRFPDGPTLLIQAEQRLAATGRADSPLVLFNVGFCREARGDGPGALYAYRKALAQGLADPHAAWARAAPGRLGDG